MNTENREDLQQLVGDGYQLQWIIGHGGMSTVWLADDVRGDREVAIKVLRPEFSDNTEFLSRFRNEAQSAESITSENVVATYDYRELEDNGRTFCFMALEYVRGESLADLLAREGALPETLALDVMEQAAHGLAVIHRMGLVHRDIKPGNLMITQNGRVKITDFGIAKAAAAVPLTRTGMVVGTAQYVSPEQAQGLDVTPASDVYSLGVVGYEMLAGKRPFSGDSSVSVALAHISQAPEPLSTSISAPARELIGISLRKDPTTRFADGNEFTNAVAAVRNGQRPPQPKSGALAPMAAEPSPSASTEMLASVANPKTATPERAPVKDTPRPVPKKKKEDKEKKKGSGFGVGLLIAAALAALAALGFFAANFFKGAGESTEPTTPPESIVVTEYRDPVTTEVVTPEETTEDTPEQVTVTTTHSVEEETPTQEKTTPNQPVHTPTQQEIPTTVQQETEVNETPTSPTAVDSLPDNPLENLLPQDGA